jgi:hypothetical protein
MKRGHLNSDNEWLCLVTSERSLDTTNEACKTYINSILQWKKQLQSKSLKINK